MNTYQELKEKQPAMINYFFAFGNTQFAENRKKAGLEDIKIYSAGNGLYGTQEGLNRLYSFYEDNRKEIAEKCNPQDAYDYEFDNHECEYVGDDEEAIKLIISYFGNEKAKQVERRYEYQSIDDITF